MPSGGFFRQREDNLVFWFSDPIFRQRTSYPESIEKRKSSLDSKLDSNVNIPTITKAEKPLEPSTTSSRATQTDLSHVHQVIPIILKITSPPFLFWDTIYVDWPSCLFILCIYQGIKSRDLYQLVTNRCNYIWESFMRKHTISMFCCPVYWNWWIR